MHLPFPHPQPQPQPEPPAMVRSIVQGDVMWNRPIFKAPPLELQLQAFDARIFAEDLKRIGLVQHR